MHQAVAYPGFFSGCPEPPPLSHGFFYNHCQVFRSRLLAPSPAASTCDFWTPLRPTLDTPLPSVDTFQLSILVFSRIVNQFHGLAVAAFLSRRVIDQQSNDFTLYIGHYMQIERSPGLATERTLKCRFQDASRLDFSILLYNNYRTTEQIIR